MRNMDLNARASQHTRHNKQQQQQQQKEAAAADAAAVRVPQENADVTYSMGETKKTNRKSHTVFRRKRAR